MLLAAVGLVGVGCSFSDFLSPGGVNISTATPPDAASTAIQISPLPEPTPTVPDLFPEPQGLIQQSYSFEYGCNPFTVSLPLHQSSYEYFLSKDKSFYYHGALPDDWQEQFYLNFLSSDDDLETVNGLIDEVSRAINQHEDELVIALISLVQQMTYDCDKLFSFDQLDGEGYQTNFPYETLYTQKGVCGDTSILLGKILGELGYGAALLVYEGSNHMALGIQCPLEVATYIEGQRGYCYIETTGPSRIGVKPTTLGGKEFVEVPVIIPIAEGKSFIRMITLTEEMEGDALRYGNKILHLATCQEIVLYQEVMRRKANILYYDGQLENLGEAMDNAFSEFNEELEVYQAMGCSGTLPQKQYDLCVAQKAVVDDQYKAYEGLVNEYNQVVDTRNDDVNLMNLAIDAFNSLMDTKGQSCAAVFSERIDTQEESE